MYREITDEVHQFYFENKPIDERVKIQYMEMINDMYFVYPNYRAMQYHMEYSTGKTFYFQ